MVIVHADKELQSCSNRSGGHQGKIDRNNQERKSLTLQDFSSLNFLSFCLILTRYFLVSLTLKYNFGHVAEPKFNGEFPENVAIFLQASS